MVLVNVTLHLTWQVKGGEQLAPPSRREWRWACSLLVSGCHTGKAVWSTGCSVAPTRWAGDRSGELPTHQASDLGPFWRENLSVLSFVARARFKKLEPLSSHGDSPQPTPKPQLKLGTASFLYRPPSHFRAGLEVFPAVLWDFNDIRRKHLPTLLMCVYVFGGRRGSKGCIRHDTKIFEWSEKLL